MILIGVLLLFPTMFLTFLFTLSEELPCLAIYENGMAFQNTKGLRTIEWNAINGVAINSWKYTNSTNTFTSYRIVGPPGDTITIGEQTVQYEAAVTAVQTRLEPILTARIEACKRTGQPVAFGAVTLDPSGIRIGTLSCPWHVATRHELDRGHWILTYRSVSGGNATLPVPISQIPNYRHFEAEVNERLPHKN